MFIEFHRLLVSYDLCRLCQCKACKSVADLSLKVITHYGEFTGYTVKNFSKLIGKDIIVAHQLLKNDIEQHEYWLVTDGLMEKRSLEKLPEWLNWISSVKQTESGQVPFQFVHLAPLKTAMPAKALPQLGIDKKEIVMTVSREFDADINTLFFTAVNFDSRERWQIGIKKIDKVSHALPRVGTSNCCVLDKGQEIIYISGFTYSPEKIVDSETDEKKRGSTCFILEKTGLDKTRLTLDFYLKKNFLMPTIFRLLMKKKWEIVFRQSLKNLAVLVKGVRLPVEI